jgi:anhydro-N-acetylmuramic acid kinase
VLAVGLMSGTSLDGIDVALVALRPSGNSYTYELVRSRTVPFSTALQHQIFAALPPNEPAPRTVAQLDRDFGRALGAAARSLTGDAPIDYVASHGLTLFHDGATQLSVQIGDPFVVREFTDATVVADFRRADCAAGGEGAPLVPYVDALLLSSDRVDTVALNVGGIANLSIVPRGATPADVLAWDCGPGNMLLDAFVRERTRGAQRYDRDGRFAFAGNVDQMLVDALFADPYFSQAPPKSTGREYFGEPFLARRHGALAKLSLEDGCATLLALTLEGIVHDINAYAPAGARIVVSGGGARNAALVAGLRDRLGPKRVLLAGELGIDADMKEAIAFAILGYEALRGRAAGLPRVTGARHPAVLGTIAPLRLRDLLAKIEHEVRAEQERVPPAKGTS